MHSCFEPDPLQHNTSAAFKDELFAEATIHAIPGGAGMPEKSLPNRQREDDAA